MTEKRKIMTEIVHQADVKNEYLHVECRHKYDSNYPLHRHKELEINYLRHGEGLVRVVGDSNEVVEGDDLVLIGTNLEHHWAQPTEFIPRAMEETTIYFQRGILGEEMLSYQPLRNVKQMLEDAGRGIVFSPETTEMARPYLEQIENNGSELERLILLIRLLNLLAEDEKYHVLCSAEFTHSEVPSDSNRIRRVTNYINSHFQEEIRLVDLSKQACMTPNAFSRFFRLRTHMSVTNYIIDKRIGFAAKQLVETQDTVVKICYDAGFNNITNFNRLFKCRKGVTPTEYRKLYSTIPVRITPSRQGHKKA